jgi:hypothetical protein
VLPFRDDVPGLWACLDSLVRSTDGEQFEVVIVAFDPDPDTDRFLNALEGDIEIVRVGRDTPTGAALDAGARTGRSQFLFFADPGIRFTDGWLPALVRRALAGPEAAIVTPRVACEDGTQRSCAALLHSAMLMSRETYDDAGGFGDGGSACADLVAKVKANGARVTVEPLAIVSNDRLTEHLATLPEDHLDLADRTVIRPFTELRDRHQGEDVWVIASGPSMNWVEPKFFDNKITVGVNEVWSKFRTTYLVRKEHMSAQAAIDTGIPVVVSRWDCGNQPPHISAVGEWYEFDHPQNRVEQPPDLSPIGSPNRLVVSWSTITSAIHFAAYLGAANVIVGGHDCGFIDGIHNFTGYYPDPQGEKAVQAHEEWKRGFHSTFLSGLERQTMMVRDRIREVYGCSVHGLNPFVSLALEGHTFEHAASASAYNETKAAARPAPAVR